MWLVLMASKSCLTPVKLFDFNGLNIDILMIERILIVRDIQDPETNYNRIVSVQGADKVVSITHPKI
jgi:hypothetical protein